MTSNVISREELLEEAYRIADAQGVSALSIRSLARASHVSVGTFTLDNMLAALHADAEGYPVLFGLLRRALYDAAE